MTESSLKVTIIGGGLAGALAGRFLRENHSVTILERSSDPVEAGAAISIGPNGTQLLAKVGFDPERTGSIPVGTMRMWNKDGKVMSERKMDFLKEYRSPWYFQHRADLRAEFLRLATASSEELGILGKPAVVKYGKKVVAVDVENGSVKLENGEVIESDLVIAADGVKSIVRPLVVGDEAFTSARPSGLSAFRFTLACDLVLAKFPDFYLLDQTKPAIFEMIFSLDPTRRSVVLYPCRHYEVLNFVCIAPDSMLKNATTESWSATGDLSELLSCFEDFPTWLLDLVKLATNIMLWQLRDQDPLPTYIKGRTVLVGDAAHAMTPHQGQGGTQAVEDAEGFELFNKPGITRADVPTVLRDFDAVRRPRASRIQDHTRMVMGRRTPEEMESFERYNWTYPGVVEGLRRVRAGEELIQF